jgi:hypothetical protein
VVTCLPCDAKRGILNDTGHIVLESLHYVLASEPPEKLWVSVSAFCKEVALVEDVCNTDVVAIEQYIDRLDGLEVAQPARGVI